METITNINLAEVPAPSPEPQTTHHMGYAARYVGKHHTGPVFVRVHIKPYSIERIMQVGHMTHASEPHFTITHINGFCVPPTVTGNHIAKAVGICCAQMHREHLQGNEKATKFLHGVLR